MTVGKRRSISPKPASRLQPSSRRTWLGAQVVNARGSRRLSGITVRDGDGRLTDLPADTLAVSGGWNPTISLSTHLGDRPKWSDAIAAFVPGDLPRGMTVAGAATGAFSLSDALETGSAAGADSARALGLQ